MRVLLPLVAFGPLGGAALATVAYRSTTVQRVVGVVTLLAVVAGAVGILVAVERDGVQAVALGAWEAPLGITLVADRFAALVLLVSLVTVLVVHLYAIAQPGTDTDWPFHPAYLVLVSGVALAFLTGDLFNLFVSFELMLVSSYVLLTLGGDGPQVRSGMTYVVINLVASTVFVIAIAVVYAATGTVNMADLAAQIATLPGPVRTGLGLLLLGVFGVKAGLFPLFSWLPDAYPTAPAPVTAVFAGLLTKVGVVVILRTQTLLFPDDHVLRVVLLVAAGLTMVIGVLGAIAQDDMKRILSFHIVSQIGYMVLGIGVASVAGLAGTIVFLVHQIPVKTALFLVGGVVETRTGTAALHRLGGLRRRAPLLAGLFTIAALSLAGLPPTSGFIGKLAIVQAGFADGLWLVTGVSLAVSILTLLSMVKIWNGVFLGVPDEPPPRADAVGDGPLDLPRGMVVAAVAMVAVVVAVPLAAGWITDVANGAAEDLVARTPYLDAVLRP